MQRIRQRIRDFVNEGGLWLVAGFFFVVGQLLQLFALFARHFG